MPACDCGKRSHTTKASAELHVQSLRKQNTDTKNLFDLNIYPCPQAQGVFHVGHSTQQHKVNGYALSSSKLANAPRLTNTRNCTVCRKSFIPPSGRGRPRVKCLSCKPPVDDTQIAPIPTAIPRRLDNPAAALSQALGALRVIVDTKHSELGSLETEISQLEQLLNEKRASLVALRTEHDKLASKLSLLDE
jgi:hypothetical protein